jgi:OmpA-OmpF porin, OOP family
MKAPSMLRSLVPPTMRHFVLFLLALAMCVPFSAAGRAADAEGCRDMAGLKRFDGSDIVMCGAKAFAEYTLPTGRVVDYDFSGKTGRFDASEALEGRLTQNVYAVPMCASSAEVIRNYRQELEAKGFKILYAAQGLEMGESMGQWFADHGPGTQIFAYSPDQARYIAAVKEEGGVKTAIALFAVEFVNGYEPRYSPAVGQVMVRLDTVEIGALQDKMTLVSAEEIDQDLVSGGKVSLYGILFDFNKATIRPESRPALDEIGRYLREHPDRRVYVIGHTDNVGGFDFNMTLSKARAGAVAAELTKSYGIAAARLKASGVGLQAPVASNATEEGRGKNRRVELVPQ